jgi:hypothetical protein
LSLDKNSETVVKTAAMKKHKPPDKPKAAPMRQNACFLE